MVIRINRLMIFNKLSIGILFALLIGCSQKALSQDWHNLIRNSPYHFSKNFHSQISEIRQWVLFQQGFCSVKDRHILFNRRGEFLSYHDNLANSKSTQLKLNQIREKLFKDGRVSQFVKGSKDSLGFPFALNCDQPHADVYSAMNRLFGIKRKDRLWGTWDGLKAGTKKKPIALYQLVEQVYRAKSKIIEQPVVASELRHFLAQIIIESGAQKHGLSKANAIGLLQLKPDVLKDCQIPKTFYRHRMAQVDCAVRLFQQNRRNLLPVFNQRFGHLPAKKKTQLFSLLLTQSYHSGIGRMIGLLEDAKLNKASQHFAKNHSSYSAGDIASGIIFHNLGRQDLGFASLYYVVDIAIVAKNLCDSKTLKTSWLCK